MEITETPFWTRSSTIEISTAHVTLRSNLSTTDTSELFDELAGRIHERTYRGEPLVVFGDASNHAVNASLRGLAPLEPSFVIGDLGETGRVGVAIGVETPGAEILASLQRCHARGALTIVVATSNFAPRALDATSDFRLDVVATDRAFALRAFFTSLSEKLQLIGRQMS